MWQRRTIHNFSVCLCVFILFYMILVRVFICAFMFNNTALLLLVFQLKKKNKKKIKQSSKNAWNWIKCCGTDEQFR